MRLRVYYYYLKTIDLIDYLTIVSVTDRHMYYVCIILKYVIRIVNKMILA